MTPALAALALALALQGDPAEELVRKLGSESIDDRAAAARALAELGEAARPALQKAARSPDLEVSRRAAVLLRVLDLRGRLSPALRQLIPDVEERLSNGADPEWTEVLLQAGRAIPAGDLALLAPAALRGARTPQETLTVCDILQSRGVKAAAPEMLKLLSKPDVGRGVANGLEALDGPELRRGLLALAVGGGPQHGRLNACDVLLRLDAEEALPALARLLEDPEAVLRRKGLEVLVWFEAMDRASAVVPLLKDKDPRTRDEAALTLRRLGAREAVPALIALLDAPREETRLAAVRSLDGLRAKEAILALAERLEDSAPEVRAAAAWALGSLGKGPGAPLLKRLDDEDAEVRAAAVWAVARAKLADARVLAKLADPDEDVRAAAAWAAGALELRAAAPALLRALEDEKVGVRRRAARAAGRLGLKEALPALRGALDSAASEERADAARALGHIGGPEAVAALLTPAPPGKKPQRFAELREGAFEALRRLPAEQVLPAARALLEEKDRSRRRIAVEALRASRSPEAKAVLLRALAEDPEEIQGPAARALGELGAREAIPALLTLLEDAGSDANGDAAYALSLLGASEALPALRRGARDPRRFTEGEFVRALERFGDDASRDFVIAGLPEYHDEGIYAAAMWLCREGRKVAIQPLLDDGEVFTPLNALRRPAEWQRLCAARFAGDLEGSLPELAEMIGAAAGLEVEWHMDEPDLDVLLLSHVILNPGGRLTGAEALLELTRKTDVEYEAMVEAGRIRIVPWDEAEEFWTRWGEKALRAP